MKRIAVLTGAGISAESGIQTFRDANGLWEGHRIEEVATPGAFERNPGQVLAFYNQRRHQLQQCVPNAAHRILAEFEAAVSIRIITQNVDDLHERAGSCHVLHLHGELLKVRSTGYPELVYPWTRDLVIGDGCERGCQLRPHIVWFGEEVPNIGEAGAIVASANALIVIGTSLQVNPAAGLLHYAQPEAEIIYIDPRPGNLREMGIDAPVRILSMGACDGMELLKREWLVKGSPNPMS